MSAGNYSVIRCVPDPARGELFNIGIAIWLRGRFIVDINHAAARRAAKENPYLAIDAYDKASDWVNSRLLELDPINKTTFQRMRKNHRGTPYLFAAPQFVNVPSIGIDPLDEALQKLMERVITVRVSAVKEHVMPDPVELIQDKILSLISTGKVRRRHPLIGKKTGWERHVDFLSGSVALDVLNLDFGEDAAMKRAELEAYKIYDLKDDIQIAEYYVLPFSSTTVEQRTLGDNPIHKAIASVAGKIVMNIREAEEVIRRAVA